jgi:activating signal cointegrator 1
MPARVSQEASSQRLNRFAGIYQILLNCLSDFAELPFGAIIGQVNLVKIVPIESFGLPSKQIEYLTLEQKAFGDYSAGRFAWVLEDPVMFNHPLPARGHLRLWNYKPM